MTVAFDYHAAMEETVAEVRAKAEAALEELAEEWHIDPALAHVVLMCVPAHAFGATDWYTKGNVRRSRRQDEPWFRSVRLDWEAGHHRGGYLGYDFDQIERMAEFVAVAYCSG